jgi:diketogulonate reductase-like aldo/keto reductase
MEEPRPGPSASLRLRLRGRYIDTADCHRSAPAIAEWMQALSKVRKEIFLVTKNHPCTPRELIARLDRHSDSSRSTARRCS